MVRQKSEGQEQRQRKEKKKKKEAKKGILIFSGYWIDTKL